MGVEDREVTSDSFRKRWARRRLRRIESVKAEASDIAMKRFIELTKCMALGVSLLFAGAAVKESAPLDVFRAISAIGCMLAGAASMICGAFVYLKPVLHGMPPEKRRRVKPIAIFVLMMLVVISTIDTSMKILKERRELARGISSAESKPQCGDKVCVHVMAAFCPVSATHIRLPACR
ncbi:MULTISPECIES: hypothetical protein [Xanthomonas]|uniref:hypothetical protein n=1 Tax=Xanthomonas TaxID=338 RepID=UPI000FD66AFB|nr:MULTISPECIES: hypothetical protein [Xanthomonas]MCW3192333.1 hypothetical protein [Xanthomonas citri pv. fuscans]QTH25232.1 hypothetical protein XcfCFBP6166P_23650 [Xanthomonas citri pv. phaseoli var. fuscans]QTH25847.1 hypothetical protein XcfCFBP7767P_24460 [Xanthomonas citri pv. phaseoli var. fuscans]QTJ30959.1 hypothetical protein XcfCFBP6167P_24725 [Xanthomonas citri pv. phaseoli var. fuscans]QTJ31177.1 hypothetical protein XcfCFBP6975P_23925 [Xanthomonas citri pv. phaseoli var. fuscan